MNKISYSQLNRWLNCPHYHYLVATKQLVDPPNIYTASGKAIHGLSEILLAKKDSPDDAESLLEFAELFKRESEGIVITDEDSKMYMDASEYMVKNYIKDIKNNLGGDFEVIFIEKEISSEVMIGHPELQAVQFVGYVDFILKKDDQIFIFDLKTVKKPWKDAKRKDKKYLSQMYSYKYFICNELGYDFDKVKTKYYFLDTTKSQSEIVEVVSEQSEITGLMEDIKKMGVNFFVKRNYIKSSVTCDFCNCKKYYSNKEI